MEDKLGDGGAEITLKADFHCHVKLIASRRYHLSLLLTRLRFAKATGLHIQAITEHADVDDFWEIIASIEEINAKQAVHGDLLVLPGVEVPIREHGDVVLVGSFSALVEMERRLGRITLAKKPAFLDLMDATEDLNFLRIGAHPSRQGQVLWKLGEGLYRLDALEINSRELRSEEEVRRRASQMGIPVVSGSDAHLWPRVGAMYNTLPLGTREIAGNVNWPSVIKELLRNGQVAYEKRTPEETLFTIARFLTGSMRRQSGSASQR